MKSFLRILSILIVVAAAIITGMWIGRKQGRQDSATMLIENYAFVREIAELASLEVSGTTTFKSSNITEEEGFWAGLKKTLLEKTVTIVVPYSAKFGVDLNDSNLHFERKDSVLFIRLPQPRLLSLELRLDRMETSNRKGLFLFESDELYTGFQKKMYRQTREQLEHNTLYLSRSQEQICGILQRYFAPLRVQTRCLFDNGVQVRKD